MLCMSHFYSDPQFDQSTDEMSTNPETNISSDISARVHSKAIISV
jgi:hypothetical protein